MNNVITIEAIEQMKKIKEVQERTQILVSYATPSELKLATKTLHILMGKIEMLFALELISEKTYKEMVLINTKLMKQVENMIAIRS